MHLDSRTNPSIGSFAVGNTGGWQTWTTVPGNITRTTGTHTVFLEFTSGQPANYVSVNWFTFASLAISVWRSGGTRAMRVPPRISVPVMSLTRNVLGRG